MTTVLAHLGPELPGYVPDCICQLRLFNPTLPIRLILDPNCQYPSHLVDHDRVVIERTDQIPISETHQRFRSGVRLDASFRGGFWVHAMERFFYLAALMRRDGLTDVIHLENDNLLYFDVETRLEAFRSGGFLGLVLDNDQRCIPSVVFARNAALLEQLTKFYVDHAMKRGLNDMEALARFRWRAGKAVYQLPILPSWMAPSRGKLKAANGREARRPRLYADQDDRFRGVFDAAAIGQFLGGVDPHNQAGDTRGFVNESAVLRPDLLRITWPIDSHGRRHPVIEHETGPVPILNLHIHSKRLDEFLSK